MSDAKNQAAIIYETIRTTSADRPFSGHSLEQMNRDIANWKANNPALIAMEQAAPEVQTAFLYQSCDWIKAESRDHGNFRVVSTLIDATLHSLHASPKPLSTELILKIVTELRRDILSRHYFPFRQFLSGLSRDQVTDEIRAELHHLHLQYAPSPTGKIQKHDLEVRNQIAELMYIEGEKQLDAGRGPWSQIVFDEIAGKDNITASAWHGLLEHGRTLEQTVPGAKWKRRCLDLTNALGDAEVERTFHRWLALGPTPGQLSGARSPIEDSTYQKGVVWCIALVGTPDVASTIGDFAIACLRKVPMLGAVSQKVGFACIQALGSMECTEAITQLSRLRSKVKHSFARRLIEKSLDVAAKRSGLTVEELEDFSVPSYAIDIEGKAEIIVGDAKATVRLCEEGKVTAIWQNTDGKLVKSVPAHIKKAFASDVKSVSMLAKELEQAFLAQRYRLESCFTSMRSVPIAHWRRYFVEHPLLGFLGRRLIWVFSNEQGWERSGLYSDDEVRGPGGEVIDLAPAAKVRLWHPLSSEPADLQQWRERIFVLAIRQPFRQAFRECYQLTENELQTRMYSNRFAGTVMRQHQLASLCRARGWEYRLMSTAFDGYNTPTKNLQEWNVQAEFKVDLLPDRDESLKDSALAEESGMGISLFVGSDQVRFYRGRHEIALDEVPAVVFSEVMREVDLFTSVCAIGEDESWMDQGDHGSGILNPRFDLREIASLIELRAELLSRVLPTTQIASRCEVERNYLKVQGQLGTYHVQLGWAAVALVADNHSRLLRIPQVMLNAVVLDQLPPSIELDYRTEMILRKAYVLADDWNIRSPELVKQLMPD